LVQLSQLRVDFNVDEALNFIAFEALICTGSPVRGLRPVRAGRLVTLNAPKPGHATLSPFFAFATTVSKNAPIVRSASAFETFAALATASMSSDLVIIVLLLLLPADGIVPRPLGSRLQSMFDCTYKPWNNTIETIQMTTVQLIMLLHLQLIRTIMPYVTTARRPDAIALLGYPHN
jgi:hypothetical protein